MSDPNVGLSVRAHEGLHESVFRNEGGFTGRRVLITGASGGIGRATALAFAKAGAKLFLGGRDLARLEKTARLCFGQARIQPCDISDPLACERAVEELIKEYKGIDVLVHAAGLSTTQRFTQTTPEAFRHTMAVDFESNWWLTRAVLPHMLRENAGRVIFVGSVAGKVGFSQVAAYVCAKHAQLGLMRALASEYARTAITFNAICPYYVRTPMTERSIVQIAKQTGRTPEEVSTSMVTPQGVLVDPAHIAQLCVFLASDGSQGISGQAINIDGGKFF